MIKLEDLWRLQSEAFLYHIPPEDFFEWDYKKRYDWVYAKAWQPLEDWEGSKVYDLIESHTREAVRFLELHGVEVK